MVQNIIREKDFLNKREYISSIYNYTTMILKAYGVLSVDKLHEIMNLVFIEIDQEELITILRMVVLLHNNIHLFENEEICLITDTSFENEDKAYTFYCSLDEGDYKIFTKEEYEELEDGIYHQKFEVYDELIEYLNIDMDLDSEELVSFEHWFILDYLNSYQQDIDQANKNLMINLNKTFPNLKIQDKAIIKRKLSNLGKLYPIYNLKGYAIDEDKINDSILYKI